MDLSLIDILGLLQSIGKRDYVKYLVYLSEVSHREMVQLSDELGKNITTQTAIIDMDKFQLKQLTAKQSVEVGIECTKIMECHYPESLRKVFIINGAISSNTI